MPTDELKALAEAIAWLRKAVAEREAGVQQDRRSREKVRENFNVALARSWATIGELRLDHAQAILTALKALPVMREALGSAYEALAVIKATTADDQTHAACAESMGEIDAALASLPETTNG